MQLSLAQIIRTSRPRFWIYLMGPYIVGFLAGMRDRITVRDALYFIAFFAVFSLPANLLIYGVNDLFDYETDKLNKKKGMYEELITPQSHATLRRYMFAYTLLWSPLLLLLHGEALAFIALFLALGIFYSAPPIRAKTIPLLDSAFNFLYAAPGFFGFALAQQIHGATDTIPPTIFFCALAWTMAMHAYSAVPDIEADRLSNTRTVATQFGRTPTLLLCGFLYATSALFAYSFVGAWAFLLGSVYLIMIAASLKSHTYATLFSLYRTFPLINTACGFILFLIVLQQFFERMR